MGFELHCPQSPEEAVALCASVDGTYLAGGTVLMVNRYQGKDIGHNLISLERIECLREIRETHAGIEIGACVTMEAIEQSSLVKEKAYALWQAAGEVGGPQVRNRGTVGGNLAAASPSADCAAPLLALNASLRIRGPEGTRILPLHDLFAGVFRTTLNKAELIEAIILPADETVSRFKKVGKRNALAISCINMAVARRTESGRPVISVAVGAAAPTPRLCVRTGEILNEGPLTRERLNQACRTILTEISPIDDRWASAEYRRMVCVNLLKALLKETEGF